MRPAIRLALALAVLQLPLAVASEAPGDPLLDTPARGDAGTGQNARGVLRARDHAVLASELAGRIVEMPFAEGEDFKKGSTLARFDCAAYQAQLNAAQAAVRASREELDHNRQLAALKSVGRYEVSWPKPGRPKPRPKRRCTRCRSGAAWSMHRSMAVWCNAVPSHTAYPAGRRCWKWWTTARWRSSCWCRRTGSHA